MKHVFSLICYYHVSPRPYKVTGSSIRPLTVEVQIVTFTPLQQCS